MNWKRNFLIGTAICEFMLSVSPFIPFVRENIWAPATSISSFASTLATYVGLEFLLLSLLVGLLLLDFKSEAKEDIKNFGDLLNRYTPLHVRQLGENQFYKEFLGCCVSASHYINICYFSPRPPAVGGGTERVLYYSRIASVMQDNPGTRFRRLVRDTEANRKWVLELAEALSGTHNCSIALLRDQDQSVELAYALSVQVVDGRVAWLVAIAEHSGAEFFRDIAIENEQVAGMLSKYFDRLWQQAEVVFKPGDGRKATRHAIEGIR